MYRIDGGCDLPEQVLGHLSGYRGSAPVRTGNAAGYDSDDGLALIEAALTIAGAGGQGGAGGGNFRRQRDPRSMVPAVARVAHGASRAGSPRPAARTVEVDQ